VIFYLASKQLLKAKKLKPRIKQQSQSVTTILVL